MFLIVPVIIIIGFDVFLIVPVIIIIGFDVFLIVPVIIIIGFDENVLMSIYNIFGEGWGAVHCLSCIFRLLFVKKNIPRLLPSLSYGSQATGILTIFTELPIEMMNSVGPAMASLKAVRCTSFIPLYICIHL